MKYLTRVRISLLDAARLRLSDSYAWHRTLWQAFPVNPGGDGKASSSRHPFSIMNSIVSRCERIRLSSESCDLIRASEKGTGSGPASIKPTSLNNGSSAKPPWAAFG